MICPNCLNDNAVFVEVENPEWYLWECVTPRPVSRYGVAIECSNCGLRGPGAFEPSDDENNRLAIEFWDTIIILDKNMRQKIANHFVNVPTLNTDRVLDYLVKINKEAWRVQCLLSSQ